MERDRAARDAARVEVVRIRGREVLRTEFSELLHEASAIVRQKGHYAEPVVTRQQEVLDVIHRFGESVGLSEDEVDHVCEDEFARRQEEAREARREETDGP